MVFYALTSAFSAFLLFLVEPMFAKMILPRLGGAANVWITAMLFYQLMLLAGYGYAHVLGRFAPWRQWQIHLALLALSTLALPLAIPSDWTPPVDGNPAPSLLFMMTLALGAPFGLLSATAPLAQRWFFVSRPNDDPYLLYAFSNAGSFAALFAYPLLVEPGFSLKEQTFLWTAGFLLFAVALLVAGPLLRGNAPPASQGPAGSLTADWRWLALAALPSSLMLSTTSFLTMDVASIPLLWIVPLALYLLTFIIAFSSLSERAARWSARVFPPLLIATALALVPVLGKSNANPAFLLPFPLLAFLFAALLCHCRLAELKPAASHLTLFFLFVSCGGALGGVFNSLVAPVVFDDVYEFPLGLTLACLVLPASGSGYPLFALAAAAVAGAASAGAQSLEDGLAYKSLLVVGAAALVAILRYPKVFAIGLGAFLGAAVFAPSGSSLLVSERNFYGVNRVRDDPESGVRRMEHGTTVHGLMALAPAYRLTPLGYYNPKGPLAEATQLHAGPGARIAVIGLGAGEMVCNGGADWRYDFYEIDPGVARIASDPKLFPFLAACPAQHSLIMGDGRRRLLQAPVGSYHEIILDAFTSDSIPLHLLTRDALDSYIRKLKPDGLLLLHLSNRYFNLPPAIAAAARDLGLSGAVRHHLGGVVEGAALPVYGSLVVALARDPAPLDPLYAHGWKHLKPLPGVDAWTDDWSHLLSALNLPGRPAQPAWD